MSELPLFLFRGKQRDRAKDGMVRGAGNASEGLLLARDPNRAATEQGKDRGWVAGMVEQWKRASGTRTRLQRRIRW